MVETRETELSEMQNPPRTTGYGMLVFGALFVALGIAGLTDAETDPAWVWAGLLAAAGTAGLAAAIRTALDARR